MHISDVGTLVMLLRTPRIAWTYCWLTAESEKHSPHLSFLQGDFGATKLGILSSEMGSSGSVHSFQAAQGMTRGKGELHLAGT